MLLKSIVASVLFFLQRAKWCFQGYWLNLKSEVIYSTTRLRHFSAPLFGAADETSHMSPQLSHVLFIFPVVWFIYGILSASHSSTAAPRRSPSEGLKVRNLTEASEWCPTSQLSSTIRGCALDIDTLTPTTDCRLEISGGGPLSCSHLSFFLSFTPPPSVMSQLFPAGRALWLSACSVMGSLGWYVAGIFGSR